MPTWFDDGNASSNKCWQWQMPPSEISFFSDGEQNTGGNEFYQEVINQPDPPIFEVRAAAPHVSDLSQKEHKADELDEDQKMPRTADAKFEVQ
ncbi:hypothetical protein WN943_017426 [Citrus x changshan-huyou]